MKITRSVLLGLILSISFSVHAFDSSLLDRKASLYKGIKPLVEAFKLHVSRGASLPEEAKLSATNSFFNQFTFKTDLENYGVIDYWASPLEFLNKQGGDCEDYVIIKAFALIAQGVSPQKLRMAYVHENHLGQQDAHMVLFYMDPPTDPLVLDNVIGSILPLSKRNDLLLKFTFDMNGYVDPAYGYSKIPKWIDVLRKAKSEGFTN